MYMYILTDSLLLSYYHTHSRTADPLPPPHQPFIYRQSSTILYNIYMTFYILFTFLYLYLYIYLCIHIFLYIYTLRVFNILSYIYRIYIQLFLYIRVFLIYIYTFVYYIYISICDISKSERTRISAFVAFVCMYTHIHARSPVHFSLLLFFFFLYNHTYGIFDRLHDIYVVYSLFYVSLSLFHSIYIYHCTCLYLIRAHSYV